MTEFLNARVRIVKLIDLLKADGGLLIEARIVETVPDRLTNTPQLSVDFTGVDAPLLLQNNGELLQAIQDVANAALRLNAEEYYLLWFDVNHSISDRRNELQRIADSAVALVRKTAKPYAFAPMRSSERRLLHQALVPSGLKSSSGGYGFKRCVILYPEGVTPPAEHPRSPYLPPVPRPSPAA